MSLAETLVNILVIVLIISLLLGMYLTYTTIFKVAIAYNHLDKNSLISLDKLTKVERAATQVVTSHTFDSKLYSTDNQTLILELPSIDADQNIVEGSYDYQIFYLDPLDNSLLKSNIDPDASSIRVSGEKLISENIESIIFNYNSDTLSQVSKIESILVTSQHRSNSTQRIIRHALTTLRN